MNANLSWTPSTSTNVVSQHITVLVNGASVIDQDIGPAVDTLTVPVNPGDNITASVNASDGTWQSDKDTVTVVAPNLNPPAPPTGLAITFA